MNQKRMKNYIYSENALYKLSAIREKCLNCKTLHIYIKEIGLNC